MQSYKKLTARIIHWT